MKPTIIEISLMITREWREVGGGKKLDLPREAKVVTGERSTDAHLHYLLTSYGIDVSLKMNKAIEDYSIVDEKKFLWFVLKYS